MYLSAPKHVIIKRSHVQHEKGGNETTRPIASKSEITALSLRHIAVCFLNFNKLCKHLFGSTAITLINMKKYLQYDWLRRA